MKIFIAFILFFSFLFHVKAEVGVPPILNIPKSQYAASGQNWAIDTDDDGRIYIGNSKGLLQFYNGETKLLSLPDGDCVYAVLVDHQRVYVGSFEEFGYFEKDKYGQFNYFSLSGLLKNYAYRNDQIQYIARYENKVYWQSPNTLFIYDLDNNEVSFESFESAFVKTINNKLYAYQKDQGVGLLENGKFNLIIPDKNFNNDGVVTLSPYENGKILILTSENGFYVYGENECKHLKSDLDTFLKSVIVNQAMMLNDSIYIVGTLNNGVYAFDGAKHLKWNVNTTNGIQNNTVHAFTADNQNNIWVALDNGFSCIRQNSDVRFIKPFKKDIGSVFSAVFHNDYLYVATNQGLFYNKDKKQYFEMELLSELSGKVADLQLIDNELICSHPSGTYVISGEKTRKLSDIKNPSALCRGIVHNQQILAQPTSTYLNIYRKDLYGKWYYSHSIEDFLHPINHIEIDMLGNIWVSYSQKGIFCIKLNSELTGIESIEHYVMPGIEDNKTPVNLFKIKGRIVFCVKDSYFTYDDLTNAIIPFKLLNENLSVIKNIGKVIGVNDETYWCITDEAFVKIKIFNNLIKKERYIPFSYFNWDLPDYNENMINNRDGRFIFCLNNGIAILDENFERNTYPLLRKVEIESVNSFSKENTQLLELQPGSKVKVPFSMNNLSFRISDNHSTEANVQYIYKLEGLNNELIQPTSDTGKDYFNLPWGSYDFQVKAFDRLENEYAIVSYEFEIIPPFYATRKFKILYVLLLIGFILGSFFLIKNYIRKSNERIAKEQEKLRKEELEIQEKEIIKLKNLNLESELTFKSKELANIAITLTNRDGVLQDIKAELQSQKEKLGVQFPNKYYNRLMNLINENLSSEDNWKIFQTNFDRIHEGFFRNLKEKYPELTPNDLKLCSLLRLNLSTKDMASFLNITVRGVEYARYRLRKKLNLPTEKNIVDFLIEFK